MVFLTSMFSWRMALAIVGCIGLATAVVLFQQSRFLKHDHKPQAAHETSAPQPGALAMLLALPIVMMFFFYMATSAITVGMASFTPSALGALFDTPLVSANAALTALLFGGAAGVLSGGWVADKLRRFDLIAAIGFIAGTGAMCVVAFVELPVAG